jgi:hypothetical protein
MAVTSKRSISIQFGTDLEFNQTFEAIDNATSPGEIDLVALSSGANTITPPTGATACTIIPNNDNTVALTLKGVAGDTGIALALTSPTSIGLAGVSTFVINAASAVTVRLIWS